MKRGFLLFAFSALILCFLPKVYSQYNYGLEISEQDLLVNGRINLNIDTNSIYVGHEAGININKTVARNNTVIGYQSGKAISTGFNNAYFGNLTGGMNSSGRNNTFIGSQAGYRGTSGFQNVFIGSVAGFNSSGSNNVMIGVRSGGSNSSGVGNIFIGRASGQNETGSNKLYIESAEFNEDDNTSPLIYGEFDNDLLRINGSIHVTDFARDIPIIHK